MALFWCFFNLSLSFTLPLPCSLSLFLPCNSCWIIAGILQWLKHRPHLWCSVFQRYCFISLFVFTICIIFIQPFSEPWYHMDKGHCHPWRDHSHHDGNASAHNQIITQNNFTMALQWSFPQRDKWTQTMLGKYPLQNIPYVGVKFEGFSVNMSKICISLLSWDCLWSPQEREHREISSI